MTLICSKKLSSQKRHFFLNCIVHTVYAVNEWMPFPMEFIVPHTEITQWCFPCKCSFLMSFIVSLSSSPPFILLWLQFFQFALKTMTWPWSLTFATLFLRFQDTIVFLHRLFFFWTAFFEGPLRLCSCSFQLFFWLSPLTWIGSVGLVSALSQDPDYQSQCVNSMEPQAGPPC